MLCCFSLSWQQTGYHVTTQSVGTEMFVLAYTLPLEQSVITTELRRSIIVTVFACTT
jgi:hypothetical protein